MDREHAPNGNRTLIDASAILLQREVGKLVALSVVAATTFFVTHAAAAAIHTRRQQDAAAWYTRGQQARQEGRRDAAIIAFRRATAIDHERTAYRLALAGALSAARHDDSARQLLLGIRELTPEDPNVNEQLARLEGRSGNVEQAQRYYQAALYGNWPSDRANEYRQLRIELVQFLLQHGQYGRALSELLILAGNIPDDVAAHNQIGELLMQAGDAQRALEHFRKALRLQPGSTTALVGAATAAFSIADYRAAQRYFRQFPSSTAESPAVVEARTITDFVLRRDPLAAGLSMSERRARLETALAATSQRLIACAAQSSPQDQNELLPLADESRALREALSRRRLRDRDGVERGLAVIGRVAAALAEHCGPPTAEERALSIIWQRHENE